MWHSKIATKIYFVSYGAVQASVSATCRYHFAVKDFTKMVLSNPSNVTFDGNILKVNSNANSGDLYQLSKLVEGFYGKHTIVFSDINKKFLPMIFLSTVLSIQIFPQLLKRINH